MNSKIDIGSVCLNCNGRGWILRSNGKVKITEKERELHMCLGIPESEVMIKCYCRRDLQFEKNEYFRRNEM